jgi:hypothetical protein
MVWDVIRILSVSIGGAIAMFLIQPWLYQSGVLAITDVEVDNWIAEKYMTGAAIVFATALAATLFWYLIAVRTRITSSHEVSPMRLAWALLLLVPIIGIGVALFFFNGSNEALLSLALFYVLDIMVVYWFSTAISSPGLLKFVPLGSFTVRHLIGLK